MSIFMNIHIILMIMRVFRVRVLIRYHNTIRIFRIPSLNLMYVGMYFVNSQSGIPYNAEGVSICVIRSKLQEQFSLKLLDVNPYETDSIFFP